MQSNQYVIRSIFKNQFKFRNQMLQFFQQAKAIQQKYTLQDFLFRWKKVERVIEKEGAQGLLLITGMDAADCASSNYLFNWLFLGLSGKNIFLNKYLEQAYNETIVFINSQKSFVFASPAARSLLEHLIYGIPNCVVFCPTQTEYNNKEVLDTLKITFFYQALQNKKKIGIYLQENQEIKLIQKWPIIQAYALEPVGRTFFTLQFQVINLNTKLSVLFKNLDKHSLKNLVSQTAFSMQGHLKGTTDLIQLTKRSERKNITQKKLQQCLQQTVDIQNSSTLNQNVKQRVRVLFGKHTSEVQSDSSSEIQIDKSFHITVQHYDPYTQIQLWRTYFLENNLQSYRTINTEIVQEKETFLTKTKYVLQKKQNKNFNNQRALILSYMALVQGTLDAISAVTKDYRNLNQEFLHNSIFAKVKSSSASIYGSEASESKDLNIWLQSYDSFGEPRPIDFKDVISFKLTSTFYVLKCRLNNIRSPSNKEQILGSVVFSECFLLQEGCYLLLTKQIPYFDFWASQEDQNQLLQKLNPNYEFEELGKPVSIQGLKNRIFIPLQKLSIYHFNIPILNVKYYFHQKGIRIYNQKIGWKLLFYSEIQDLTLVNKIPGQWVLFKLKEPILFGSLQTNILFIQFRGKAFQIILKRINDKSNPLQLNYLNEIPPILGQNWYFTQEVLKKAVKQGAFLHNHQIIQKDFLWSFIQAKQLMILNQMKDIKLVAFKSIYQQKISHKFQITQKPSNKHHIIVINGSYGSNKLKLAQNLARFGPTSSKYSIFSISSQNLYARIQPQTYIQMLEEHISDNNIPSNQSHIVIAILPSWLDNSKLFPILSEKFYVRTVLSKVSSNNFFSNKNKNLVQNVLTYCLPGFSQNIILDTYTQDQNLISSIMKILWIFNSQAKISRASNGMISTGQCTDIVKDQSFTQDYSQFLRNKYSTFYRFDSINSLSVNYIPFKFPFYDYSFTKSLTKTSGYIIDYAAILEQLKSKKIQAQNSKDQLMIGLYNLQESITIAKRRQKVPHIRQLKGVVHINGQTGDKEFIWANKDYREKAIHENSKQFGFFLLSENYDEGEVKKFLEKFTYKKFLFQGLKKKISSNQLTQEQIKQIQKQSRNKYLQNGDFFDGYFYRNIEGFILPHHPQQERIISEWIQNRNKQISAQNSKIDEQWQKYSKQYK